MTISALLNACGSGDVALVRHFLALGADIDEVDSDGDGVLRYAVVAANSELFELLLNHGADVHAPMTGLAGEPGSRAIIVAAGVSDRWLDGLRMLLERGANPNERNREGITPLMVAAACGALEAVRLLLRASADLDAVDADGDSALYYAASRDQLHIVSFLRQAGATLNPPPNSTGGTPLTIAAERAWSLRNDPFVDPRQATDVALHLARHGADAAPMYSLGFVFAGAYPNGMRVAPLYDVYRAVNAGEVDRVAWLDRRVAGLDRFFEATRTSRWN